MPYSSVARRMLRTAVPMSLGSTSSEASNRSGCCWIARTVTSLPSPTRPTAMPCLSIASKVTSTGSSPSSRWLGTSLNMYSDGNSIAWEAASFARCRSASYFLPRGHWGTRSSGPRHRCPMASSDRLRIDFLLGHALQPLDEPRQKDRQLRVVGRGPVSEDVGHVALPDPGQSPLDLFPLRRDSDDDHPTVVRILRRASPALPPREAVSAAQLPPDPSG